MFFLRLSYNITTYINKHHSTYLYALSSFVGWLWNSFRGMSGDRLSRYGTDTRIGTRYLLGAGPDGHRYTIIMCMSFNGWCASYSTD